MRSNGTLLQRCLLVFIPLTVFILSIFVLIERSPFHASWYDPVYAYLLNGLNIATDHFYVGHVDHPGTPMQLYSGLLLRLFHLFSNDKDIVHDVLLRPEWYLFRMSIAGSFIIAVCMYIAGSMTLKFTSNLFYALLIQLTHVISFKALFFSQNLMAEFILVICGILLAPLLVIYTFSTETDSRKTVIAAAVLAGIMVAGKFPAATVCLVWLFIMKSRRHFFLYTTLSIATFILVTFPAWHAVSYFKQWVIDLLTHTGHYGTGSKGFANWTQLFQNTEAILAFSWLFVISYFIISLTLFFNARKIFGRNGDSPLRTLSAAWFAITLHLLMVSKHFALHYFIPAMLLLMPCMVIMLMRLEKYRLVALLKNTMAGGLIAAFIAVIIFWHSIIWYQFFPGLTHPGNELNKLAMKMNYDIALFDYKEGGPLPQPALSFGNYYAGNRNPYYTDQLEKLYPQFYFYYPETGTIKSWRGDVEPASVLRDSMKVLYYHAKADSFNIHNLHWKDAGYSVDSVLSSFTQSFTKESLYLVSIKKEK